MATFLSIKEMLEGAEKAALPLWQYIQTVSADEVAISPERSWEMMAQRLEAMKLADASYCPADRSLSGLVGGDAERMRLYAESGRGICGRFADDVLTAAIRMGECNACMHRIVAAPTAGACGVLPAILLTYAKHFGTSDDELIRALYISAGFGAVIAQRASISGAEAGCQAEIGSAAAMAAAALVYLHGGSGQQMAEAMSMALKNMMGLVCDPVAGLVEVPCVKRNAAGAMNALSAAEMAMAGICSRIPADEVIDAMASVGASMPAALRETGLGGVAASPTGIKFREEFFGASLS